MASSARYNKRNTYKKGLCLMSIGMTVLFYVVTFYLLSVAGCYGLFRAIINKKRVIEKSRLEEEMKILFFPLANTLNIFFLLGELITIIREEKQKTRKKKGTPDFAETLFGVKESKVSGYVEVEKEDGR